MTIETLQAKLRDLGLYSGDIDGDLGPGTYQGLARYATNGAAPEVVGDQLALDLGQCSKARFVSFRPIENVRIPLSKREGFVERTSPNHP